MAPWVPYGVSILTLIGTVAYVHWAMKKYVGKLTARNQEAADTMEQKVVDVTEKLMTTTSGTNRLLQQHMRESVSRDEVLQENLNKLKDNDAIQIELIKKLKLSEQTIENNTAAFRGLATILGKQQETYEDLKAVLEKHV